MWAVPVREMEVAWGLLQEDTYPEVEEPRAAMKLTRLKNHGSRLSEVDAMGARRMREGNYSWWLRIDAPRFGSG